MNDLDQAKTRDLTGLNASGLLPVGVATFAAGSLYAWSALVPALMERYGVGHTEAGKTFSLAIVAFTASVLMIPQLPRRYRSALAMSAYALAASASIVAAAMAPTFALFLTAFSFGFGFCSGAIYIASLDLASAAPRPAIAVPLMVAAFGVGGAIMGPLLGGFVASGSGLRSLYLLVGLLAGAAVLLAFSKRWTPRLYEEKPIPSSEPRAGQVKFHWPSLAMFWVMFASGSSAGLMILGFAPHIIADRGASVALGVATIGCVAIGNSIGRLSVGVAQYRLTPIMIIGSSQLASCLCLFSLSVVSDAGISVLLLALVAMFYGVLAAAMPLLTRAELEPSWFSANFAIIFTGWGFAGLTAPWIAGILRDQSGSFHTMLLLAGGASAACVVLTILSRSLQTQQPS